MNANKQFRNEEAKKQALDLLQKGDTVYTILRKVSRSGMSREIGLVVFKNSMPYQLNAAAGSLLNIKRNDNWDGLKVSGAGMDMGFHLVYELSRALFGDGYALNHRWL